MAGLLWRESKVLHPRIARVSTNGGRLRRTAQRHPSKVGAVVAGVFLRIQSHSSTPCLGALRERICGTVNGVRHET